MKTILPLFLCLIVQASLAKTIIVTNGNDAGPGSLRNAIEEVQDGDVILLSSIKEVTLTSGSLIINKSVIFKGNGTTLRANFSPIMNIEANASVRWERINFEVPSNSFTKLSLPRKAKVTFEACTGQWENSKSSEVTGTNNGFNVTELEVVPVGGVINYFLAPCLDPDGCSNDGDNCGTQSTSPSGISGNTSICSGTSTTLTVSGGSLGTNAEVQWFEGSCGSTVIGRGNSITVSPTNNTTYFVRYSGSCNTTSCASVTVTVSAPLAPTGALSIINSSCGDNCTLSSGSIAIGSVSGTGGTLQYSTNGGATWNSALPTYNPNSQQIILASVLSSSGCRSTPTQVGSTNPGTCVTPAAPTGALSIINSSCGDNCTLSSGSIAIGSVSGTGGTLQYSTNGGATWNSALPTYNPNSPQTILASVLSSNGCRSASTQVGSTNPGTCPTTTFYRDADGDGFGNPSSSIQACSAPAGFVSNNTDCDDNNAELNPNSVWYLDADSDGYYIGTGITQCTSPGTGYRNSGLNGGGDCNDANAAINPGATESCDRVDNNCNGQIDEGAATLWYLDADGDGFASVLKVGCTSPGPGYTSTVLPFGDCDDNNAAINPNTVWYEDRDNDGFSSGTTALGCERRVFIHSGGTTSPGKLITELTNMAIDCNDNDEAINPGATEECDGMDNNCNGQIDEGGTINFYIDADGDGFGNPNVSIQACSAPAGFVSNNTDCDDSRADINPNTVWYEDRDGDGFPSSRTSTGCSRPQFFYGGFFSFTFTLGKLDSELSGLTLDCDDTNASVSPATIWYKDADNDGFSDGTNLQSCFQPQGFKRIGTVAAGGDCDDSDPSINPNTRWYPDFDNDGYSTGNFIVQCSRPDNFKLQGELTAISGDCNDIDAAINPNTLWFRDQDGDGYTNGQTLRQCTRPENYKLQSELTSSATDCNDGNSEINPATKWYKDADNDGFSDGNTVIQCSQPVGYKLPFELVGINGDCDDSDANINPGSAEVCGNGNDDDCNPATSDVCILPDADGDGTPDANDCAPNDATKWRAATFFIDTDNDGYDGGQQEVCYGEEIPAGYRPSTLSSDCDDSDAAITVPRTWYKDADNDGFSTGNTLIQCLRPQGYKLLSELTATTGDCDDTNAGINPGSAEVCGNGKDDDCNPATSDVCILPDADGDGTPDLDDCAPNYATKWRTATFFIDTDNDGYDSGQQEVCYGEEIPAGYKASTLGSDCDDSDAAITVPRTWYKDTDNDGFSNGNNLTQCDRPQGYKLSSELTATAGDCDDTDANINPGAGEVCDGIDNNCNGQKDEGFADTNNNGIADCVDPENDMISFTLINAGTDTDILELTNGLQVSRNEIQGISLNIRANTNPSVVGSVFLTISGPVNRSTTENLAPYALFGDRNGDYNGRNLPNGNYILTATPYSQSNRRGTVGETTTIQFSIVPSPVSVTGITTTPSSFSLEEGSTRQISATVEPLNATNKTVIWSSSDQGVATVSSSGLVVAMSPGEATITATTQDGNFSATSLVTVIQRKPPMTITSFTLVNAGTDNDILTITNGLQISQNQIQGLSLNIRANTNPELVGSVYLTITGPVNRTTTENVAPYALFGDRNGNYNGRNLPIGNYILTATPYAQSNRRGTQGLTQTLEFSITSEAFRMDGIQTGSDQSDNPEKDADAMEKDSQARDIPRITRMYPNPVSDMINLEFSEQVEEQVEVSIYDLKGVRLFNQEFESENGKLVLDITNLRLKPGMFVLMVNTNGYPQTFKFLKK